MRKKNSTRLRLRSFDEIRTSDHAESLKFFFQIIPTRQLNLFTFHNRSRKIPFETFPCDAIHGHPSAFN